MIYYAYTRAALTLLPSTTQEQAVQAIAPILNYIDIKIRGDQSYEGYHHRIDWLEDVHGLTMEIDLSGDVGDSYLDAVREAAENLSSLIEPSFFEVVNSDCPNPDEAKDIIWAGEGEALERAQRTYAISEIKERLCSTIKDKEAIEAILTAIANAPLPSETQASQKPAGRMR